MVCSLQEKEKFKKVLFVFKNYIRRSPYIDIVYSRKMGYFCLRLNPLTEDDDVDLVPASTAEELCEMLLEELVYDVINSSEKGHDTYEVDAEECAEITKNLEPYLAKLPEYHHLVAKLYKMPD